MWQVGRITIQGLLVLLLASASQARRRLLQQAGIAHRVRVSGFDEALITDPDPIRLVQRLAEAKARAVAQAAGPSWICPDGTACIALLACDSVLTCAGEVFGKPRDEQQAIERWQRMAGQWSELHTGHCLMRRVADGAGVDELGNPTIQLQTVSTRLRFAQIDLVDIIAYVKTGEPLACAGGFALEGRGGMLIERLEGCYSNVIGLSLPLLRQWLPRTLLSQ